MKPVFISPSMKQIKEMEEVLRQAGIDVSVIEKKHTVLNPPEHQLNWCELWLKHSTDMDKANSLITQHEFKTLRQMLSKASPVKVTTAPEVPFRSPDDLRKTMEQAHLPVNNQHVFRRLAVSLGFSEKEAEQADCNKLYRPWDNKSLMERVKILQQMCISTRQTPPDTKRH